MKRFAFLPLLCAALLGAAPHPQPGRIAELVKQLGDDEFEKRQAAGKELEKIGAPALGPLRSAATFSADLEVRRRASELYRKLAAGLQLCRYEGHTEIVVGVAFSPDGKRVLSCGPHDGTVRLLDAATGKLLRSMPHPQVRNSTFSPDGTKAISVGYLNDQTLRLWDLQTGLERKRFRFEGPINRVACSADGKQALFNVGPTLRLLDLATGKELKRFEGHTQLVHDLALSADGKRALSASYDATVRVWDTATGKELMRLARHKGQVWGLALSPDGKLVASGGADRAIRLWCLQTGKEVRQLAGHAAEVHALSFSPDGRYLASAGYDHTVRLWGAATGKELHRFAGHSGRAYAVDFSPDGRFLVSGSADKTVRVWRVPR